MTLDDERLAARLLQNKLLVELAEYAMECRKPIRSDKFEIITEMRAVIDRIEAAQNAAKDTTANG